MTAPQTTFSVFPGHVTMTTFGVIQAETAAWLMEMRSASEKAGLQSVAWRMVAGALVDKARNEAVRGLLQDPNGHWLLFVDGDMVGEPDALIRILQTAYAKSPQFDVVGGYCALRGELALPTIDTGTGTWESHYPGNGVVEVMRTGGAFLLIKRHVVERIPDPWFALRVPMKPLDALVEVDNFCRTIHDGRNPFRDTMLPVWEQTLGAARGHHTAREKPYIAAEVGEDSSFCDRVTAAGMRIAVDTDIVIRHIEREAKGWESHRRAMDERAKQQRLLSGMTA